MMQASTGNASVERMVFVYGTLRRGEANDITQFSPAPRYIGSVFVMGTLYDLGDYPGLLMPGGAPRQVCGEVYAVADALEQQLDVIEGILPQDTGEYNKRLCAVQVAGAMHQCLVYAIAPDRVAQARVITGGDWVRRNIISQYENLKST
jgi:gamma-glutamylcyclotransferase (GGCT)/AIG2-like uncharacterized protein YtfP